MERLRVSELLRATGGELVSGNERAWITGITTDSRRARDGELFVPLVGERFDGHDFIGEALRLGASATLMVHARAGDRGSSPHENDAMAHPQNGVQPICIVVDDTLVALHQLARYYRRKFDIPVIAVTGSVGKTTTKDTIASVLSQRYRSLKTWKNYNNEVGVPLTIFQLERGHQAMVLELGMRAPGEIARLAWIAEPSIGVVTNVSEVHLETLGSLAAIARAKGELIEALPPDGLAVLNGDDARVRNMKARSAAGAITYGLTPECDVWADDVETREDGSPAFTLNWRGERALPTPRSARGAESEAGPARLTARLRRERLHVNRPGTHQVWSAMAAAICGLYLGMDWEEVAAGLGRVEGSGLRMEIVERNGVTWINDSYNASLLSVRTALETLLGLTNGGGRPVAVLGDMLELGEASERAHREVGREVAKLEIPMLVTVGPAARWIAEETASVRPQTEVHALSSVGDAVSLLQTDGQLWPGDCVLLKASRGIALERVIDGLVEGCTGE